MSCQRKILTLGGTFVRQTSSKWETAAPCDSLRYIDLVEKTPDYSRF
jgi:hypothetical protein